MSDLAKTTDSDFPRITIERMREVMAGRDSFAHVALNARFNYGTGRGRGWCSCCGEVKVCADWLPPYQVCSTCFNEALPEREKWLRKMSEDEAAAVKFYSENPSVALADFDRRTSGVAVADGQTFSHTDADAAQQEGEKK